MCPLTCDSECASCLEEQLEKNLISLQCQHKYCETCFSRLVLAAMQNETLFPPKCCLEKIPSKTIMAHLKAEQRKNYQSKAEEYTISNENRWYCPSASCSIWIPPSKIKCHSTSQKCPRCSAMICSACRGLAHSRGQDCPQEFGLQNILEEAELQGWRRCYRCHALVELAMGCRHIRCNCSAEFW
jgi:IBR domain, a half RING-finger domain/Zinc finger, C3HC4 type (RING finger)